MNKKRSLIGGIVGILGGILIIAGGIIGDDFPKALWILAALCQFVNVIFMLMNYRYFREQQSADTEPK